jgi:hypothetical protein
MSIQNSPEFIKSPLLLPPGPSVQEDPHTKKQSTFKKDHTVEFSAKKSKAPVEEIKEEYL